LREEKKEMTIQFERAIDRWYGLVNRALQSLAIQKLGRESWREICEKAQIDDYGFVNFMPYPDSVTYQIAAEAAKK
jgi:hypothetical protein